MIVEPAFLVIAAGGVVIASILVKPRPHEQRWTKIERLKKRRDALNEKLADAYGGGTRCPLCLRWPWETEKPHEWTTTTQPAIMTCGTCGNVSYWVAGPVMIPVTPPPLPIFIGE